MSVCIFILTLVVLALTTVSLIGFWKSDSVLGAKWSITCMLIIVVACFYTSFRSEPFKIDDEVAFIGVIAAIVAVPVTVLLGWNIYTVVDFNRKVEKAEEKVREKVEVIKAENQKLKDDYLELENSLKYMQSDITFTSIFNYARKMDKETYFVQYAIDGYIDALNVAIKDGLNKDRIDVVVNSLFMILDKPNNLKSSILPNMTNVYYSVVSKIHQKGTSGRSLGGLILKFTEEEYVQFPPGYVRIMSDYNPDSPHTKS